MHNFSLHMFQALTFPSITSHPDITSVSARCPLTFDHHARVRLLDLQRRLVVLVQRDVVHVVVHPAGDHRRHQVVVEVEKLLRGLEERVLLESLLRGADEDAFSLTRPRDRHRVPLWAEAGVKFRNVVS